MNLKLKAIADEAAENLQDLVEENEVKLLEAWDSCEAEAQANETAPKFKLGLSITLDLDADKMETALTWGVRYKATTECSIPDPAQGKLLEVDAVMLKTPGCAPVTVTRKQFSDLARGKTGGGGVTAKQAMDIVDASEKQTTNSKTKVNQQTPNKI
jgi:hypothetical protein